MIINQSACGFIHGPFVDLPRPGEQAFFGQTTGLFHDQTLLDIACSFLHSYIHSLNYFNPVPFADSTRVIARSDQTGGRRVRNENDDEDEDETRKSVH
jgi:hypothetical protein